MKSKIYKGNNSIIKTVIIITSILFNNSLFSQSPQKMSYQAVIRNSSNALIVNQSIGMRISILQGSASGAAIYSETQVPTTNANGLTSIEIGSGTILNGFFSNINWANGPYFIKTETDPTGGTNYTIIGISQMLSVPYALYAENVNTTSLNTGFFFNSRGGFSSPNDSSATKYNSSFNLNQNYKIYSFLIPRSGQIKNLIVTPELSSVPFGSTVTVSILLNGIQTSLAVTFTSADGFNIKSNSTTSINVNQGDFIAIKYKSAGSVNAGTSFQAAVELK